MKRIVLIFLLVGIIPIIVILAQNPNAPYWPRQVTDNQLFVASNKSLTTVASLVGISDTSISVVSTSTFTVPTIITIDSEFISICSKTSNSFSVCANGRGFDGSTAAIHAVSASVYNYVNAWYFNQAAAEIKAIEASLSSRSFLAGDYVFTQTPGGSLSIGSNAITLTPCPIGINGSDPSHYVYISSGVGAAEAVLVTGGTCTSGAATGTIIASCANTHSASWTVSSATGGLQEAICSLPSNGGNVLAATPITLLANVSYCNKNPVTVLSNGVTGPGLLPSSDGLGNTMESHKIRNYATSSTTDGGSGLEFFTSNTDNRGTFLSVVGGHDPKGSGGANTGNVSLDIYNRLATTAYTGETRFVIHSPISDPSLAQTICAPPGQGCAELTIIRSAAPNFANLNVFSAMNVNTLATNPGFLSDQPSRPNGSWRMGQEVGGTAPFLPIDWAYESAAGGVTAGRETYLTFDTNKYGDSWPIAIRWGHLRFDKPSMIGNPTTTNIGQAGAGSLAYNVPIAGDHEFTVNGVKIITFSTGGATWGTTNLRDTYGTGSPQSVITALPGSIYRQTDGSTNPALWVKETGSGTTGWRALDPAPALFASLAACSGSIEGQDAPITDSTTNTWGATITGGGANHVKAYCDGTNWTVMAK